MSEVVNDIGYATSSENLSVIMAEPCPQAHGHSTLLSFATRSLTQFCQEIFRAN